MERSLEPSKPYQEGGGRGSGVIESLRSKMHEEALVSSYYLDRNQVKYMMIVLRCQFLARAPPSLYPTPTLVQRLQEVLAHRASRFRDTIPS